MNTDRLLEAFLIESDVLTEHEVQFLLETAKTESVKEIVVTVLKAIKEKVEKMDTTPIDRSRGDIKRLRELGSLQEAVTQLEVMIERSAEAVTPELQIYLKQTVKSIMYLNQYSAQFKDAYRGNKTLLILKYQSLVMSIFSSVSYLISVLVDFSAGDMEIVPHPKYQEIAPITTLMEFNRSVEKGEFRNTIKNVTAIREHYVEVEVDDNIILEAGDILSVVIKGIQDMTGNNKKFIDLAYKATGIVTLVLSFREIFYMFYRARTQLKDVLGTVETFANASMGGASSLATLNKFASKFVIDAEESTKIARRDIESENKMITHEIKTIPKKALQDEESSEVINGDFDLDF